MKKILAAAVIIFSLSVAAKAETSMDVQEVLSSSITFPVVSISSYVPTQIDATALITRKFLAFQNHDTTYKIYCSERSNVTIATAGLVVPENFAVISIPMGYGSPSTSWGPQRRLTLYCLTSNTTGPSNMGVFQGY